MPMELARIEEGKSSNVPGTDFMNSDTSMIMDETSNYRGVIVDFVVRENPRPGPHFSLFQGTLKITYELTQEQMDVHLDALSKNQHNGN